MRVIVIGAGLAGLSVAWYLREGGAEVALIERHPGPGLGCSFANAALQHPSMAEPWNCPGVTAELLRNFFRRDAHIRIRLRALPTLLAWGIHFIRHSRADRHFANTVTNVLLARYSACLMSELRTRAALEYGAYLSGSLQVFRSARVAESTLAWVRRLASFGLRHRALSVAELVAEEPALTPIRADLVGGIHMPDDAAGDAYRFCCALAARLQERGVQLHYGVRCTPLRLRAGRAHVCDDSGRTWPADAIVMAAASDSVALLRGVGLALPVRPVKGYSITAPSLHGGVAPRIPVMDPQLHLATVPLAAGGLRVAATAEFAGLNTDIDPRRVANIISLLQRLYPQYSGGLRTADVRPWAGLRPMCTDGVPLLGPTRIPNVFLNTGHGHLGWTLAAGSGRLVADQVLGAGSEIDPRPYQLARIHRRR
jgi:D-amino-acid dehydrogenase